MARRRGKGEGSIFKRKDGVWQGAVTVGYNEEGKQKRKTEYGKTQAEVRGKIDEIKHQLASGTFNDSNFTVKTYLERWLAEKARQVEKSTMDSYERLTRLHIVPRIGRVPLIKLTALQVQSMMREVSEVAGVRTANACRTLLYSSIKQAMRWQLVSRNVAEAVDPIKKASQEMALWTPDEAVRFLDTASGHRLYAAFYLAMSTGLRRGELLGLRWSDLKGNVLHIRQQLTYREGTFIFKQTKTERGKRRVAISEDVLDVLTNHRKHQDSEKRFLGEAWADTDLVFTSEVGTPIHPRNFDRTWKQLKTKAGVPQVRLHDLRHLHVSLLVKQGFDPATIADRVGHTDPAFTLRKYTHMFEEQRQAAAIGINDLLKSRNPGDAN